MRGIRLLTPACRGDPDVWSAPRAEADTTSQVSRPVRFRLGLEELGATRIKLGQALALRFDLLPASYCYELFRLFNAVAPSSYAEVKTIIRSEFGGDIADVYASVDPEPFAAASIAQVHRATLPSGESVAVKVQRPRHREPTGNGPTPDVPTGFLPDLIHLFDGMPRRDVIDEFALWLDDELDYVTESMKAFTIRENARSDPIEYSPRVRLEYSTERVLNDGVYVSASLACW